MKERKKAIETPLNHRERLIRELTGAPVRCLPAILFIMRHEVFHNPVSLDWLTREEFREGALEAWAIYRDDHELYDAELAHRTASCCLMGAEIALKEARETGDAAAIESATKGFLLAAGQEIKALVRLYLANGIDPALRGLTPSTAPAADPFAVPRGPTRAEALPG